MGFTKKTWKNRIAEYINRRRLTMEDGSTNLVTVARDEGTISQEGDAFNAANMNDLENRIEEGFDEINQSLTNLPKIEYGIANGGTVKFKKTFKEIPTVILTARNSNGALLFACHVTNVSTTKFSYTCAYTTSGSDWTRYLNEIGYIAIGN